MGISGRELGGGGSEARRRRRREIETLTREGNGTRCPPPQPTRGKLAQRGLGQSPGRKRVLVYFTTHVLTRNVVFLTFLPSVRLHLTPNTNKQAQLWG